MKKNYFIKIMYVFLSILMAMPSIVFLCKKNSLFCFKYENTFLLNNYNLTIQAILYALLIICLFIFYLIILKNSAKLFKNIKRILIFVAIISLIYAIVVPFLSSDVFYYIGIGRLWTTYNQNPYYVSIYDFVVNNGVQRFSNDLAFQNGAYNIWSCTTVVYGPIWTIVCGILSKMSFGKLGLAVILFKLFNVLAHLTNTVLIYKISKKSKFAAMYGLSPFVLLEGMSNVHNDLFFICLVLLAIYFLKNKKNICVSLLFLALSFDVKFISILFLPLMVIYFLRDYDLKGRILGCIKYGIIFLLFCVLPFFIFMCDLSIFKCMLIQNTKYARSLYAVINYFTGVKEFSNVTKKLLLGVFSTLYIYTNIKLILKEKISFVQEMQSINMFLLGFILLILTNFQSWYLIWLFIPIIWQKSTNIKFALKLQFICLLLQAIYIRNVANLKNDAKFFIIFVILSIIEYILIKINRRKYRNELKNV